MPTPKSEIEFNRPKKYRTLRVLGHGACGETVLIRDDDMGVDLVVKKYRPSFGITPSEPEFSELMERFREEARILFQLNHPNIVRVYNFFDYKEHETAYIIMEHIEGTDIETHVKNNPLNFDSIFEKVIGGFEHLESKGILHRDIRPLNLLVSNRGEPKIIDFGFGKQIDISTRGPGKSISLNWWCETPPEFQYSVYDTQTEVYFVGKLFEHVMVTNSLDGSKHAPTISRMCAPPRDVRFKTFATSTRISTSFFLMKSNSANQRFLYTECFRTHLHQFSQRWGRTLLIIATSQKSLADSKICTMA